MADWQRCKEDLVDPESGEVHNLTPAQAELLDHSPHLLVVDVLHDGDLLALDLGPANPEVFVNEHFGPYILTRAGEIQDANYHYAVHHAMHAVPWGPRPRSSSPSDKARIEAEENLFRPGDKVRTAGPHCPTGSVLGIDGELVTVRWPGGETEAMPYTVLHYA